LIPSQTLMSGNTFSAGYGKTRVASRIALITVVLTTLGRAADPE